MSAGEPGTVWSERLQCWVADPDLQPQPELIKIFHHVALANAAMMARVSAPRWPTALREPLEKRGEWLIDKMVFWVQIPLLGWWIASRLADNLDKISEVLERQHLTQTPDTLPTTAIKG